MSWWWGVAMGAPTTQILRNQAPVHAWSLEAGRTRSISGELARSLTKSFKAFGFVLHASLVEECMGWLAKDCGHSIGPGVVGFQAAYHFSFQIGQRAGPSFPLINPPVLSPVV